MLNALFESISSYLKEVLIGNPTTFEAKQLLELLLLVKKDKYCL
jgi:hypothetical protein